MLKEHKPELSKFGVSSICLFGSYLHSRQTSKSDIDLLIDFEPDKENFDNYLAVYDIFEGLFKNERFAEDFKQHRKIRILKPLIV